MDVSDGAGDLSCDRRRFYDLVRAAPKSAVQGVTTSQPPTDPGYLMRIADGKVGLYRIGSSTPYELLDEPLNLLSEYDREQLEQESPHPARANCAGFGGLLFISTEKAPVSYPVGKTGAFGIFKEKWEPAFAVSSNPM